MFLFYGTDFSEGAENNMANGISVDQVAVCPLCGKEHKFGNHQYGTTYYCDKNNISIDDRILNERDNLLKERFLNCIYNYAENNLTERNGDGKVYWHFYYKETEAIERDDRWINVFQLMKQYPYQVSDRIDKILLNLSNRFPLLSDHFWIQTISHCPRLFYCESKQKDLEIDSVFSALKRLNYIEKEIQNQNDWSATYRIAIDGWKRIAELKKNQSVYKYGFIAMSFSEEVAYIERIFKQAIQESGYEPRIIKDKEHNNYIMPEIFAEIQKSKFVVVDVTKQNNGAYFEAGYAQALGKEVIVCCKKEVFEDPATKPHFDIAQKATIVWEDEADLLNRLKRRIEATVL